MTDIKLTFCIGGELDKNTFMNNLQKAGFEQISLDVNLPVYTITGKYSGTVLEIFEKCKEIFREIKLEKIISEFNSRL